MRPEVQDLLTRLAREPGYADDFFADPEAALADMDLSPADREALAQLDREAVLFLDVADQVEPPLAEEHPVRTGSWATALIALWGCASFVVLWLVLT